MITESSLIRDRIHKPKYQDEEPANVELIKQKTRDKSQTRSIFGRKKTA